jgi:regulator of protease activity HflC (stomatin/prohibitin superfamily)
MIRENRELLEMMLILGLVLLLGAFVVGLAAWSGPGGRGAVAPRAIATGAAVLGVVALILSAFTQIGAGQVGVSSLFGAVDKEPLSQGLHLINPLKRVTQMSTRTEAINVHAGPGGRKTEGESVDAISADGMRMPLDATVYYRLSSVDAPWVYQHLGPDFADKIVVPATRTAVREALARFTAQEAYSTKRDQMTMVMQDILRQHVRALLDDYDYKGQAVAVQQVLLRNIGIPDQVRDAIEKKLAAEQQALAMQFVLQKETQEAERKRIEARGIADFQKIVTEGISDKLLAWKGIEATLEISKSPNAKVVVIGNSKNGLPIIFDSSAAAATR